MGFFLLITAEFRIQNTESIIHDPCHAIQLSAIGSQLSALRSQNSEFRSQNSGVRVRIQELDAEARIAFLLSKYPQPGALLFWLLDPGS